uniref:Uncharacterized protein n=2 Tax=Globodera TaxID=31242 RepID=A0A914GXZ9_GLORO
MIQQIPTALLLVTLATALLMLSGVKTNAQNAHLLVERDFGNAERVNDRPMNGVDGEVIDKMESRLLGALELLQTYRDAPIVPKFTVKRKNKFEFIRFGKRRR